MDICEQCGLPIESWNRAKSNPRIHIYRICVEGLRAEVEALRPDAERWRAQERAIALAQAEAERLLAFDTLPDDYETGDW